MGLPDTVKTRSLKIIDFINNNKIIKNDNQGRTILSHLTGITKNDFINTDTFCKRLYKIFHPNRNPSPLQRQKIYSKKQKKEANYSERSSQKTKRLT